MDTIEKALRKLNPQQKKQFKHILVLIQAGKYHQMDVKKLKNREDIYRVRKGKMRIIFHVQKKGVISILSLEYRSDKTYR